MHLIYRRLNGYDIPLRLPPELIPPADRTLKDTMDSLKNSLKGVNNKPTKPPKPQSKPDGTRFKMMITILDMFLMFVIEGKVHLMSRTNQV